MTINTLHERTMDALDELRPAMVVDGGGVEVVSFHDDTVTLRLIGSCLSCPSRQLSADALIRGLKSRVTELKGVDVILT